MPKDVRPSFPTYSSISEHFQLCAPSKLSHVVPDTLAKKGFLNDRPGDVWNDSIVFLTKVKESRERNPDLSSIRVDEEVNDGYCEVFRASWNEKSEKMAFLGSIWYAHLIKRRWVHIGFLESKNIK